MIAAVVGMGVVTVVVVEVRVDLVVAVAVKSLVWAGTVIDTLGDMLTINVRADVVSYSVDVLSGVVVGLLMDAFADVLAAITIAVLRGIGVDVLADVNVNTFASAINVKFAMPARSKGFGCWAAFDCRPMAVLGCVSVLQARMPSCHV